MLKYVLIRILLVFPLLVMIALSAFFLGNLAPGDRVKEYLELYGTNSPGNERIPAEEYQKTAKLLDLDKPLFYFSIKPVSFPDTIYKIVDPGSKRLAQELLNGSYSWHRTSSILKSINRIEVIISGYESAGLKDLAELKTDVSTLKTSESADELKNNVSDCNRAAVNHDSLTEFKEEVGVLSVLITNRELNDHSFSRFLPEFLWHGKENRFHQWFGKVLDFDFGISIIDGRKVFDKIGEAFPLTLTYVLLAYFFTFLIAIPFGLLSSLYGKKRIMIFMEVLFSVFYSVPLFWLSTLAVIFFTTAEVTGIFNIFPSIGVGFLDPDDNLFEQILRAFPHFLLPAFVVAFHSGAYLSLLIKRNLDKEISSQYFISLLARGISVRKAVLHHAFPNSILPLVTVFIMGFPAALAGSVVIEVIFNIPGMGRLLYDSLLRNDWNVVFAIVMIIGVITYLFYIAGDLVYYFLNPKIRYT